MEAGEAREGERDGGVSDQPPQRQPFNSTREMAQSAAQKAQDAYATARQAMERMTGLEARCEALEAENVEIRARLAQMEDRPLKIVPKRKAA